MRNDDAHRSEYNVPLMQYAGTIDHRIEYRRDRLFIKFKN